jgi:NAD(P)H-hydrate epimerase
MVTETMTAALPEIETGALDDSAFDPIVSLLSGKRCLAIGPGIGTADATGRLLERLFDVVTIPMVIDADGINLVASDPSLLNRCRAPVVLTPHPGEMARLCGQTSATVQGDRIAHARSFARKYRVCLVLKGAATVVALPDGIVFVNTTGNPGMAAGGMGDVLTGMIGALIAQRMDAGSAACAGVHLHGLAADRLSRRKGTVGFLATEVMNTIPEAMQELMDGGDHLSWPELDSLSYPTDPNSR